MDVTLTQQKSDWQDTSIKDIGGVVVKDNIPSTGTVRVTVKADGSAATFAAAPAKK